MTSPHDYEQEDARMHACDHDQTFIIWERMCACCGKTMEMEIINPGTETMMIKLEVKL